MRKRFVTTFLSCILSLVCIFSLTACGDDKPDTPEGGDIKGEEVTEEQWIAAIEATLNAENFTIESNGDMHQTMVNKETEQTTTFDTTLFETIYVNSDSYYSHTINIFNNDDEEESDIIYGQTDETYYSVQDNVLWRCNYYGEWISEDNNVRNWRPISYEYENAAEAKQAMFNARRDINIVFGSEYNISGEEGGAKPLGELYFEFEYSDGKYTLDLEYDGGEGTIILSIKDGYIIEITVIESDEYESSYSNTVEIREFNLTMKLKNFGSTTLLVPDGVTEAIENAKAEQ